MCEVFLLHFVPILIFSKNLLSRWLSPTRRRESVPNKYSSVPRKFEPAIYHQSTVGMFYAN